VSGKHKASRGKHRTERAGARHRKPGPNLDSLTEKTSLLAVTSAVAAGTSLTGAAVGGGPLGSVFHHSTAGDATDATDATDAAASSLAFRGAPRADRGVPRTGIGAAPTSAAPAPSPTATARPLQVHKAKPPARKKPVQRAKPLERPKPVEQPKPTQRPEPPASAGGETCKASFYSEGQLTASGERFNPDDLTAAHKSLPFGSKVRVTNVANGESVTVRINDRGPFVEGRCLDLSRAAFDQIASLGAGVVKVRFEVL
jgi:rare lipoprotein A